MCVSGFNPTNQLCTGSNIGSAVEQVDCCSSPINAVASLLYIPSLDVVACAQCPTGQLTLIIVLIFMYEWMDYNCSVHDEWIFFCQLRTLSEIYYSFC